METFVTRGYVGTPDGAQTQKMHAHLSRLGPPSFKFDGRDAGLVARERSHDVIACEGRAGMPTVSAYEFDALPREARGK